jgi:hypothetical protein
VTDPPLDGAAILASAVALGPRLREEATENERLRRLSPATASALREAGVFRLPMPVRLGRARATLEQRAALAGSYAHTFQTCRDAVQLLYEEVGSQSVYRACPLDRHLRDLVTISQHIMGQTRMLEMAGGMWLGQPSPLAVL